MNFPLPRPQKYLLEVKRSATGLGLFTDEAITRRRFVIEYWGRIVSDTVADTLGNKYLFDVGRKRVIDGSARKNIARYINHSCRPNCEVEVRSGRVFVYSKRNIKAGEELTYDYGKDYFNEYIGKNCRCVKCSAKK